MNPATSLTPSETATTNDRLLSLDAYRGFIMTRLTCGGFGLGKFSELILFGRWTAPLPFRNLNQALQKHPGQGIILGMIAFFIYKPKPTVA